MLEEIQALATASPWRYTDAANRIILGKVFLLRGADAREVLQHFYDRSRDLRPDHPDAYIATGELALAKHDDAMAAEAFEGTITDLYLPGRKSG